MTAARALALAVGVVFSSSAPGGFALLLTPPSQNGTNISLLRHVEEHAQQRKVKAKDRAKRKSWWRKQPENDPMKEVWFTTWAKMVQAKRQTPAEKEKRAVFERFAGEVGHGLGHERSCPEIIDWLGQISYLVVPRLKLAMCYQTKAGCTDFKDLLNELNGLHKSTGFGIEQSFDYMASRPEKLGIKPESVTRKNGWKFATFTRDPLERYVAVYGSACVPKRDPNGKQTYEHSPECCGDLIPTGDDVSPDFIKDSFEQRAISDAMNGLPVEDQHWAPQVQLLHNCGWDKFNPAQLDYRGDISSGNVSHQVKEMLKMVHGTDADMKAAEKFFPSNRIAGHKNPIKKGYRSFYESKDVVDAVKSLYAADYYLIPGIGKGFSDNL